MKDKVPYNSLCVICVRIQWKKMEKTPLYFIEYLCGKYFNCKTLEYCLHICTCIQASDKYYIVPKCEERWGKDKSVKNDEDRKYNIVTMYILRCKWIYEILCKEKKML